MVAGGASRRQFRACCSDRAAMLSAAARLCAVAGVRELDVDFERGTLTVECVGEDAVVRRLDLAAAAAGLLAEERGTLI